MALIYTTRVFADSSRFMSHWSQLKNLSSFEKLYKFKHKSIVSISGATVNEDVVNGFYHDDPNIIKNK